MATIEGALKKNCFLCMRSCPTGLLLSKQTVAPQTNAPNRASAANLPISLFGGTIIYGQELTPRRKMLVAYMADNSRRLEVRKALRPADQATNAAATPARVAFRLYPPIVQLVYLLKVLTLPLGSVAHRHTRRNVKQIRRFQANTCRARRCSA